jgi:hypothetical protein
MTPGWRLQRLLNALYREPDPCATVEQLARAHHDDIAALDLDQVDAERILARWKWAAVVHHDGHPSHWLLERIQRLDSAAGRLRPATGRGRS